MDDLDHEGDEDVEVLPNVGQAGPFDRSIRPKE